MSSVMQFFRNVSSEMRKVSWPKRKELTNYTITVIATVVLLALFFGGVDYILSFFMRFIIGK
ncbi:preprotein translocase subunit SecE [Bacillus niameyensis]|uniref:preprotein translocase subunit SecE n=1 Tax=Bacillus niameyensis TaxID=1522308 RepID=UPI000783BED0|nr:preprotein translocase subunit SecE [Bacillus niameyensis]